ncbi:heterokaryon incompatibility protein-domain-containing protein [Schizothecium vesticola]|uniref:Heterokaryon incompatibility protein-domain-containing protein n=1 Tax=Schizothecium vesticola TaxID=314040 RepID=A0AA40F4A5_9PEZI|nr:heterokaryon incompatibility protein-domain-containing protein [Schizothecium vesticola]
MRLLCTDRIETIEAYSTDIPRYAILSHTWSDGEGLLQDSSRLRKQGFAKLRKSVALAKRNGFGFDYLWVDTCCIDKSSSVELSEAINSMHQWYQNADVCYAYLADAELAGSEDFTRGWTLQELIALGTVEFFAYGWSYLGSKDESNAFTNLLHEITGIKHDVLTGEDSLADIIIASRMRWASSRQTTRIEDVAYCVLGLFDVNMPLLYGEGMKALTPSRKPSFSRTTISRCLLGIVSRLTIRRVRRDG